jgi:hypothetical protein
MKDGTIGEISCLTWAAFPGTSPCMRSPASDMRLYRMQRRRLYRGFRSKLRLVLPINNTERRIHVHPRSDPLRSRHCCKAQLRNMNLEP